MDLYITGWGHTPFAKHEGLGLEDLLVQASSEALADAGIEAAEVDAIFVGTFNAGMEMQELASSLALQVDPELRFRPATRVENACASGSAAVYQGLSAIGAGQARTVLAVGVEKMTALSAREVAECLKKASYMKEEGGKGMTFPGIFAHMAELYFERWGDQSDALARIAAKNHKNGASNPLAHMQNDLGYEFCRQVSEKNPLVAGPLRRTDCSMISDGAAAVVLTNADGAAQARRAVRFRAAEHVNDFLPMSRRDILAFEGPRLAWQRGLEAARLRLDDLDLVETHDCFTIAELIQYEAMGLCEPGQAARLVEDGVTEMDGRLPVNASGGLKAKGHPVGATGVSMHVMVARQLVGEAGALQVKGATKGAVFNMGGAAVANYLSILEAV
jgi:acetyl-CoA C-acetyltransferase